MAQSLAADSRKSEPERPKDHAALRIAAIYLAVGGLWILLSDKAVSAIFPDPETITQLSIYKGWFYVLTTAVLLYGLIRRSVERIHASEALGRQFHRSTISAVTDGKLNLVDYSEIDALMGREVASLELTTADSLSELRTRVMQVALESGVPEEQAHGFVTGIGEAAANAVKHANGGRARLALKNDCIQVCIRDYGSGIDTLLLPHATLKSRYSTGASMGLGYSLMLASTDRVYLATGDKGTCVLMEKSSQTSSLEVSLEDMPDTW